MNTVLTPTRAAGSTKPAPGTETRLPVQEAPAALPSSAPKTTAPGAWPSDHFALAFWLMGAAIIGSLLIWDLLVALVAGWAR
jgi:hypothetical protein